MSELSEPQTAKLKYRKGQAVRFSSKAPDRWKQASRVGGKGKLFPATDRCVVAGFPRNNPELIYVIQEGRKRPILIKVDLITPAVQTTTSTRGTRGRPKHVIDASQVEHYLGLGFKMGKVVSILQTTRATMYRQSKTNPALKAAIINGRKKGGTYTLSGGRRTTRNKSKALAATEQLDA